MKSWFGFLFMVLSVAAYSQKNLPINPSWEDAEKYRQATVTVYWFNNPPFLYKDDRGNFKGIEYEILLGLRKYVEDSLHVNLNYRWIQLAGFKDVIKTTQGSKEPGIIGCGGFSISDERRKIMKFSPSYMADVAVLISSKDIPEIRTNDDFKKYLSGATAITIQGTLMEKDILKLRDGKGVSFLIDYVTNSEDFLSLISKKKRTFGYLNLPLYLMHLSGGTQTYNRQNYFTELKDGHGIGLPIVSDWNIPIDKYFKSRDYQSDIENIISNYISIDFYRFLETITGESEVTLLNKEKEIQENEIRFQEFKSIEEAKIRNILIVVITVFVFMTIIISRLLIIKRKANFLLTERKTEIEAQADEIKTINENLENIIKRRTQDLERKNKALEEYAFITAHELRGPLASILGLVYLIDKFELKMEDKIIINHLRDSSESLDKVVRSVMRSIEGADDGDEGQKNNTEINEN